MWDRFTLATSLPSTDRTPVPPLPKPGPSYLEVKHDSVLAARERSLTFPAEAFHLKKVVHKDLVECQ